MHRPTAPFAWCVFAISLLRVDASLAQDHLRAVTALESAGRHGEAAEAYDSFVRTNPGHRLAAPAAFAAATVRLCALRDTTAALAAFDRVIVAYPAAPYASEAARRKAECLAARAQWSQAAEAYGLALQLAGRSIDPPSAQWVNEVSMAAGDCSYQAGDRAQVISLYEGALQNPLPPHATAQVVFRLGEAYETVGDSARAAECFVRVVRDYPFSPVFGPALQRRSFIDRHQAFDWTDYLVFARSSGDFAVPDFTQAIARCDTVLSHSTNEALRQCAAFRRIVAATTLEGDFTTGQHQLDSLVRALPDRRMMPNAETQLQQFAMVADAEAAARLTPEDPAAHRALGALYLQSRSYTRAVAVLETARDLAPNDAQGRLLLGIAYASTDRLEDAEREFGACLEIDPADANALNRMGYALLGAGQAPRALPYFLRYVQVAPEDANAHDSLGEGYLGAGRLDDAVREYERAVELDPAFSNSYVMLATAYAQLAQPEKASRAFRRFLELSPDDPRAEQARQALAGLAIQKEQP